MAAALIAKAILGGIGGGMKAAGDSTKTSISKGESEKKSNEAELGSSLGNLVGKGVSALMKKKSEKGESDFNLKDLYPGMDDSLIEWASNIVPIEFKYKPEAQELYKDEGKGVDNELHVGVKAQDLEKNPATAGTVSEDEHGFKQVDTRHLAFADTAIISELCRKVMELESKVARLEGGING